jgi:hypothetical protein
MRINSYVYGFLAVALFLGVIFAADALGMWSTSGKVTSTGEKVTATGANVDEIKGWMLLGDIAKAYNVSVAEIATAFDLPADVSPDKAIKDLESAKFSVTNLRTWLKERQTQ